MTILFARRDIDDESFSCSISSYGVLFQVRRIPESHQRWYRIKSSSLGSRLLFVFTLIESFASEAGIFHVNLKGKEISFVTDGEIQP